MFNFGRFQRGYAWKTHPVWRVINRVEGAGEGGYGGVKPCSLGGRRHVGFESCGGGWQSACAAWRLRARLYYRAIQPLGAGARARKARIFACIVRTRVT